MVNEAAMGIPWWSSGWNSGLSLPGPGLIPGWETNILQAAWHGQKKKKLKKKKLL